MNVARGVNLEALRREFEESRARVWMDESIPVGQKQAEVNRLWREFDARRKEILEGFFQGNTGRDAGGEPVSGITGRRVIFPRRRRRPWK